MKEAPARHSDGAINESVLKQMAYNEKMAELGRISSGIVHALNAPLSVIVAASQMIMREDGVPDPVREMIERIGVEAQRLSQMTRGILNFSSHDDAGGDADVNLTIGFVLDFLEFEGARRGVTLLRNLDHRLPVVSGAGNVLKQILINIIMNALQAMEAEGGRLLVESRQGGADTVCLVISDTGPGIDPASLARIFEPYFTTKKPGEGTGLGLFVTRTLVENLGGTISVRSASGEGTVFTITLPAAD